MSSFDAFLEAQLRRIEQQNLHRKLRLVSSPQGARIVIDGRPAVNFSSNDYLGLASDPRLKEAAIEATRQFGAGSGASRLISGSLQPHQELERSIARFKGTEAALVFSSGYAAALGTIPALLTDTDFIAIDKLVHASIVDAARLSGATMRVFKHNDVNDLEAILRWMAQKRGPASKVLIVTESLFSMDGDFAPLQEITALKESYDAWLMVDEAHATGIFGMTRRGRIEEVGLEGKIELQMGTLGKVLGASGGFICGTGRLIDFLVNRARSFIFSTAPPPSLSGAATAALQIVTSKEGGELVKKLRENIRSLNSGTSPVIPHLVGSEAAALALAQELLSRGFFVPAIRYPTVARNKARLRISISAAHNTDDVRRLAEALPRSQ